MSIYHPYAVAKLIGSGNWRAKNRTLLLFAAKLERILPQELAHLHRKTFCPQQPILIYKTTRRRRRRRPLGKKWPQF